MSYIAIIPARGGSKGVPNKNVRNVNGKPLIAWSILQALNTKKVSRVIVSTDSEEIAGVAREYGAEVPFMRPDYLAQDNTATEPVLIDVVEKLYPDHKPDAIILLQPTSPVRKPDRISEAIELFEQEDADSLLSVCENHHFFWKDIKNPTALYDYQNRPRRQDILPEHRWYRENGSIYVTSTQILLSEKNRLGGKVSMLIMDEEESWEIDSYTDMKIIETLIKEISQ